MTKINTEVAFFVQLKAGIPASPSNLTRLSLLVTQFFFFFPMKEVEWYSLPKCVMGIKEIILHVTSAILVTTSHVKIGYSS